MKTASYIAFSILGLLSVTYVQKVNAAPAAVSSDPCAGGFNFDVPSSNPDLSDFMSASLSMRVSTMCDLRDAIVAQYSLFDMKNERITSADGSAFDSLSHLNQCVTDEKAITDDDSDLHFADRVTQCIAGFHDTHFSVQTALPIPPVLAGLLVRSIGGKYYISRVFPDVINYVNTNAELPVNGPGPNSLTQALIVGNEVVEVDGQSPASLSAQYAKYISGSSPDFILEQADQAIFYRGFRYPTKNSVEVKIKDASGKAYTLALPWFAGAGAHTRPDAMAYFSSLGIPVVDRIRIQLNNQLNLPDWRSVSIPIKGFDLSKPLFENDAFNGLVAYNDDTGLVGLRAGEVVASGGNAFCYMELLTFMTANFKSVQGEKTDTFANTIGGFVADCQSKNLNLVLDLRSNPGGNGDLPDVLLSILSQSGRTYGAPVMAFRTTTDAARLFSDNFQPELAFKDLGDFNMSMLDVFTAALKAGQKETDIIPNAALGGSNPGYSGKILALVTPDCISACDMTASLLKKSGRAVILGTHSNGTGAGFFSSTDLDSKFKDSNDELSLEIPNFMFGVPDHVLDQTQTVSYAKYQDSYLLENHPTIADIQYATTLDDLDATHLAKGWEAAVLKALQGLK